MQLLEFSLLNLGVASKHSAEFFLHEDGLLRLFSLDFANLLFSWRLLVVGGLGVRQVARGVEDHGVVERLMPFLECVLFALVAFVLDFGLLSLLRFLLFPALQNGFDFLLSVLDYAVGLLLFHLEQVDASVEALDIQLDLLPALPDLTHAEPQISPASDIAELER